MDLLLMISQRKKFGHEKRVGESQNISSKSNYQEKYLLEYASKTY